MDQNSLLEFKLLFYLILTGWNFIEGICEETTENDLARDTNQNTNSAIKNIELMIDTSSNISVVKETDENKWDERAAIINKSSVEKVLNKSVKIKDLNNSSKLNSTEPLLELNQLQQTELNLTDHFISKQTSKDILKANNSTGVNLTKKSLESTTKDMVNINCLPKVNLTTELLDRNTKDMFNINRLQKFNLTNEVLDRSKNDIVNINCLPKVNLTNKLFITTKDMFNINCLTNEVLDRGRKQLNNLNHSVELVSKLPESNSAVLTNTKNNQTNNSMASNLTDQSNNELYSENSMNISSTRFARRVSLALPPNYTKPLVQLCINGKCINTTETKMKGVQPFIPIIIKADPPPKNEKELEHMVNVVYDYQNELGALNLETGLDRLLDGRLFIKNLEIIKRRCKKQSTTPSNYDLIKILSDDVTGTRMLTNTPRVKKNRPARIGSKIATAFYTTLDEEKRKRKMKNNLVKMHKMKHKRKKMLGDTTRVKYDESRYGEIEIEITRTFDD